MTKHYAELYDDREEGKVMECVECPSHDLAWEKAHSMLSDWTDCNDGSKSSHIHVRVREVEVKKWTDNYEKYQQASTNSTETYTTANGLIAIAR